VNNQVGGQVSGDNLGAVGKRSGKQGGVPGAGSAPGIGLVVQPGVTVKTLVVGPQSEVHGFIMPAVELPTQVNADALTAKLQALYDSLPQQEQLLLAAMVGQAAEYVDQMWPQGAP